MKLSRILLLSPPAYTSREHVDINPLPPLGLGYVASVAEALGHQVRIVDCLGQGWGNVEELGGPLLRIGLSNQEIRRTLADFRPDLVGLNCQFSKQHRLYIEMFALIRETLPNAVTVAGGPHATVCTREVLADTGCDFVLIGEAENSFAELLRCLESGSDPSAIDGLGLRKGGEIRINPKTRWIADLDTIPFPAYHLMDLERYFGLDVSHGARHRRRYMPIVTSRGCPSRCTFCSARRVWGDRFRFRSVDNVIAEMKLLRERYGIEEIMFEDDNVTANPKRAKELFRRMIEERLDFVWDTPNGVGMWTVDNELLDLMQASGCIKVNFPVESGSQRVLDTIIRKPLKLEKIRGLVGHCRRIGLDYGMFLVVGMPGETVADIWRSFRFAADCGCFHPHISVATPYPGSELFEICKRDGLFAREYSFDELSLRSFLIRTREFDERTLRRLLKQGTLYLLARKCLADPKRLMQSLGRALANPRIFLDWFRYLTRLRG